MWAVTDGVKYDVVNGLKIENLWIQDRAHTIEQWSAQPYCNTSARTAVMHDGFIYIARSNANAVILGTDTLAQSVIYKVNAANGEFVKELPLTLDGNIYGGAVLSSNTVGVDNFGHLFMAPYTSELASEQPVYMVDKETGELTLVAILDKGEALQRCDYIDVMGDLTLEQAECNIMSAGASSEYVYRWHADQGGDWEGGFEGDSYLAIYDFYPETVTNWGYAPVVKMIPNGEGDYSGELFYVDGFHSSPILYDVYGTMVDNFEKVDPEIWPMEVGANGVCEFTLDGRNFFVYVTAQYSDWDADGVNLRACQVNICEMGEGMVFEGMQRYWMVPDALGTFSDGGTRVESMNVEYGTDAKGNPMVTLFIFKCVNGMAVYRITLDDGENPGLPGDVNGDGSVNISDVNEVIDLILGGRYSERADVNGDGSVNISDINSLIAIILK
jgi:hypothetical protein